MDNHQDDLICEAMTCKHYKDYAKGCVYRDVILDRKGKCKDYEEVN